MSDTIAQAYNEPGRIRYIAGLDGLRAIAVAAVFLYHIAPGILPGGFLGVQVFFVISGYLITRLLLNEWRAKGAIDLPRFWFRRARRLLPALVALVGIALVFAWIALPDDVAGLRGDALSSLFYVANWYFILVQKPYFEAIGRPSLFQHIWSLAVEEQFYVLFPLALTLILPRTSPRRILALVLAGAVMSALLMAALYNPDGDPSRVYFGTDTRAAGLLLGVALAIVWKPDDTRSRLTDALGYIGLAGMAVAFFGLSEYEPFLYYGGFTLVALLTGMVIAALSVPSSQIGRLLGGRFLTWMGTRSYGIYLWHFPILMVTRPQLDVPLDGPVLFVLRVALSLLAAELSYRFIETPIRRGTFANLWHSRREPQAQSWTVRWRWAGAIALLALVSAVLGETVVNAQAPSPTALVAEASMNLGLVDSGQSLPPTAIPSGTATVPQLIPTVPATSTKPPAKPSPSPTPYPVLGGRTILAVGDSVMLGASDELKRALPGVQIDAAVGRQVSAGTDLVRSYLASGQYDTVIIHLGNNGPVSPRQYDALMKSLATVRRVIVVNVLVPRAWQNTNNAVMSQGINAYPNAVLVDWSVASASHGDYFAKDGVHLRPAGAQVYVGLIATAISAP